MIAATPASSNRVGQVDRQGRSSRPSPRPRPCRPRVDADGDLAGKAAPPRARGRDRAPPPCRGSTRATPLSSQASMVLRSRMPPPSCTESHGLEDRLHRARVHRPARERAVQVDHVQPLEAWPRRSRPAPPGSVLNTVAWPSRPGGDARIVRPSSRWREQDHLYVLPPPRGGGVRPRRQAGNVGWG